MTKLEKSKTKKKRPRKTKRWIARPCRKNTSSGPNIKGKTNNPKGSNASIHLGVESDIRGRKQKWYGGTKPKPEDNNDKELNRGKKKVP